MVLKSCFVGEDGEEVVLVIEDLFFKKLFNIVAYFLDWYFFNYCFFVDNVLLYLLYFLSLVIVEKVKLFDVVVYDKVFVID